MDLRTEIRALVPNENKPLVSAIFFKFPFSSVYRRDQRRSNHPGKGLPTPGNHEAGSVAPRDPLEAQTGHPASSSPPCSLT